MQSSVTIAGAALSGLAGRLDLTRSSRLKINLIDDRRRSRPIALKVKNIRIENHLVNLGRRRPIRVVEHLFSALYSLNFFAVRIDLYRDELPFFDGSSLAYAYALAKLGSPRTAPKIHPPQAFRVQRGRSFLEYRPEPDDRLVVDMTLRHAFIGTQRYELNVAPGTYKKEIAPARTFVFTDEHDPRLTLLPPYGFALTRRGYLSSAPLRFPDEAVRHKILDLLGDLYVLGGRLCGTITGHNTSHILNYKLVHKILESIS
jgi:UDP-3-O-acyl-N-acetylglucosamine deacetylase